MTERSRRSQKERSDLTRSALLNAAITLIHDHGLSRTSTIEIAKAAGVSRGALTHHFESREELISSAIEQMLFDATEQLTDFTARFIASDGSSDDIVDFLWNLMRGRLFPVTLEFLPEARHNEVFRERLRPVVSVWHQALDRIWTGLADRYAAEPELVRTLMNGTMCLMRGMIAQTILRDDPPYYDSLLAFWKRGIEQQLRQATAAVLAHPRHAGRVSA